VMVVFIEPSGGGGIAHYTYCLARALGTRNVACEIVTAQRWNRDDLPPTVHLRKPFRGIRTNPFALFRQTLSMRRDAAIVHWQSTTHPRMLLWLMRWLPLRRRPWVYTVHNVLPHEQNRSALLLYEKIYRGMDGIIFHCEYSRDEFHRLFPNCAAQTAVIPHGEYGFLGESIPSTSSPPSEPSILFFGNIRPYKGLDVLLQAFADVIAQIPIARLRIAGQLHEPFDRYHQMIHQLQLNQNVDLRLEYIPDSEIPALFAANGVVALPYREIDQSGVLLLALALGKAVVASDVGGIREVIREGETGLLVPPGDASQLAQVLIGLLRDPRKITALGAAAREDVRVRFSWDAIAEQTLTFYASLGAV